MQFVARILAPSFVLAISILAGSTQAALQARASASTIGGATEDNAGVTAASATSSGLNSFGFHLAQAEVVGPSLGASTNNDTVEISGVALSLATATWWDRMTIVSPTQVNQIILSFSLHGKTDVAVYETTNPQVFPQAHANVRLEVAIPIPGGVILSPYTVNHSIPFGSESEEYEIGKADNITASNIPYFPGPNGDSTTLQFLLPVFANNVLDFTATLQVISATNNGVAQALFLNTAVLDGVFLADGTTPESQGMSLVFDSGVPSPNLVANAEVPEPASLSLWTLATLGCVASKCRRRRTAA